MVNARLLPRCRNSGVPGFELRPDCTPWGLHAVSTRVPVDCMRTRSSSRPAKACYRRPTKRKETRRLSVSVLNGEAELPYAALPVDAEWATCR